MDEALTPTDLNDISEDRFNQNDDRASSHNSDNGGNSGNHITNHSNSNKTNSRTNSNNSNSNNRNRSNNSNEDGYGTFKKPFRESNEESGATGSVAGGGGGSNYDDSPIFQTPAPLNWSARVISGQERVSPAPFSPADTQYKRYMESPRASPMHSPRVWPPSSPRVDAIPSISLRVEQLARGGRVIQMLKNASKAHATDSSFSCSNCSSSSSSSSSSPSYDSNSSLLGSGNSSNSHKRRKKVSSSSSSSNSSSSSGTSHSLLVVDKYLRRRHAFSLLDSDMIICGYVSDKTTAGLCVVIAEVHAGPEVNTKDPKTRPSLSSLSRNQTDAFQDIEALQISCVCQLCEIRAERGGGGDGEGNSASLDRFAIGDFVKALVISVDVHSEKVYISLNNARIKGAVSTHRLGLIPRPPEAPWQPPSPAAVFTNPYGASFNPYGSTVSASFNPYGSSASFNPYGSSASFNPYGSSSPSLNPYASPSLPSLRTPSFNYSYSGYESASQTKSVIKSDFCKKLRAESLFRNPQGINIMLAAYNINPLGSLLTPQESDPALNYKTLRNTQNQAWAKDSVTRGIALAKQGNVESALQHYEHALEIEPSFTHAFIARGAAYVLQGKLKEAVGEFEYALRLDPEQAHAKRYLQVAQDKLDAKAQEEKTPQNVHAYGEVVCRSGRSSSSSGYSSYSSSSYSSCASSSCHSGQRGNESESRRESTVRVSDSESDGEESELDGGLLIERERQIAKFVRKQQKEAKKQKHKKKKEKEKKKSKKKKTGKTKKKKAKESSSSSDEDGPKYSVQSSFTREPTPTFRSSHQSTRSVVDLTADHPPPFPLFSDDERFSPQFLPISPIPLSS